MEGVIIYVKQLPFWSSLFTYNVMSCSAVLNFLVNFILSLNWAYKHFIMDVGLVTLADAYKCFKFSSSFSSTLSMPTAWILILDPCDYKWWSCDGPFLMPHPSSFIWAWEWQCLSIDGVMGSVVWSVGLNFSDVMLIILLMLKFYFLFFILHFLFSELWSWMFICLGV